MMHFLKKHMLLIVAAMIIAAGGFYYRQSNVNNVEIQTTGNANCLGQPCSSRACSQCDSNYPVYCNKKTGSYSLWTFGQKACNPS